MDPVLVVEKLQKRAFLEQLLDGSKIPNHSLGVVINAEIRFKNEKSLLYMIPVLICENLQRLSI